MLEYASYDTLSHLRVTDPEAFKREVKKGDLLKARNDQALKLAKLVQHNYLSIDQITNASCRQLHEASKRSSIDSETGELYCGRLYGPEQAKRKFNRIMGLVPEEERDIIDTTQVTNLLSDFIVDHNKKPGHAEILAIVCGGSRFEEGKTPDSDSDFDIDILYTRNIFIDRSTLGRLFQNKLQREVQVTSYVRYESYLKTMERLIEEESKIAIPFQCKNASDNIKFIPLFTTHSLVVGNPEHTIPLTTLAAQMPSRYSEQPFGDPEERPTVAEFEAMNMQTTSEWYAEAVRALIPPAA